MSAKTAVCFFLSCPSPLQEGSLAKWFGGGGSRGLVLQGAGSAGGLGCYLWGRIHRLPAPTEAAGGPCGCLLPRPELPICKYGLS